MTDDEETTWTKINIRQSIDDLIEFGPTLKIGIAPIPFEGAGMTSVFAQIDTGASGTGMSPLLTKELSLDPIDSGTMIEPGRDPITAPIFKVRLFIASHEIDTEIVGLPSLNSLTLKIGARTGSRHGSRP